MKHINKFGYTMGGENTIGFSFLFVLVLNQLILGMFCVDLHANARYFECSALQR
jgi:hypothetical protein